MLESLGTGDVFGEMAFLNNAPRSADVIAKKPVEALVLSPDDSIEKVTKADGKIAAQVYRNLSRLVAGRLARTTRTNLVVRDYEICHHIIFVTVSLSNVVSSRARGSF